ncbi:MAG TPA: hemolysin family protein [Acholeplasmataceae bacterium]|nr:hemolysin family protein [Acholeplasmataceae bacterium]
MLTSIILMILLIVLSAILVASEAALVAISDAKVEEDAEEGHIRALRVLKYAKNPKPYQTTIQTVITLIAIVNGAIALDTFSNDIIDWFNTDFQAVRPLVIIVIALLLLTFHMIFGMLIPRRLAYKYTNKIAYGTIGIIIFITQLFRPIIWLFNTISLLVGRIIGLKPHEGERKVTEEEIRTIVEESSKVGSIDEEEGEMIQNVFDFSDTTVDEIMTHRTEISAISIKSSRAQLMDFIREEQYTRYPVYDGNIDHIVGTIHVKDLLKYLDKPEEKFSLKSLIRPPYFVPESKRTAELFREMQKQKNHIAVVLDEYGGTAGIVTIEDLIEEIVGNISDEYDEDEEDVKQINDEQFEIDGLANIHDIEDILEADLPVEDYDTISGFILGQLGRFPEENETISIEYNGFRFDVLNIENKIITKVRVTKLEDQEHDDDDKEV